ncbi:unnamed protein product [Candidatus Paraburkholderia kirkii UZHbot1]|uniref:WGS project CAFE00000000 data, contig bkir_c75 n=1 Tax=Candidatus Paraburkholderia kirkii UZHbot1 TaxID=1055526 RepID=M5EEV5_9BURK|nr:unnamed protein product [Candidatus Paraburkholderia kirkii UZHbot1]
MPEKKTLERAAKAKREGKSPSTQAGAFVKEQIDHVRQGKHGAKSAKQAIAIGLSEARRSGVKMKPPKKNTTSETTRKKAAQDTKGRTARRRARAPNRRRSARPCRRACSSSKAPRPRPTSRCRVSSMRHRAGARQLTAQLPRKRAGRRAGRAPLRHRKARTRVITLRAEAAGA